MPSAQPSSVSDGLRSTVPSGHTTSGRSVARRRIARDQLGGVLVGRRIEQMVRMAVAGEKILQPHHAAECGRTDQHRAAGAALDQADPAQDQRAHDALAELGLGDQQRAQLVRRDQQRLDLAFGMAVDQRDAAGELADLGEELARPLLDHRRDMAEAVALGDRDMARQHDEHAGPRLAGLEQRLAMLYCAARRSGACGRFPAASASGRSARGAESKRPAPRRFLRLVPSAAMSLLASERHHVTNIAPAATGHGSFPLRHLGRHHRSEGAVGHRCAPAPAPSAA